MTRLNTTAVDVAYNLLLNCKEGMAFKDLWQKVVNEMGYDEKIASRKISQFYTNLSLDGRFINLENNYWNLKMHCKYDEVAIKEDELQDGDESDEEIDDDYTEEEEVIEEDEY